MKRKIYIRMTLVSVIMMLFTMSVTVFTFYNLFSEQVMEDLKQLPEGSIYKLTASFLPVPLIDKASAIGFSHWILEQAEEVIIYFKKSVK